MALNNKILFSSGGNGIMEWNFVKKSTVSYIDICRKNEIFLSTEIHFQIIAKIAKDLDQRPVRLDLGEIVNAEWKWLTVIVC